MSKHLFERLEKAPAWKIHLLGILGLVVMGVADYATGFELSFSFFYLMPIYLVAWYLPAPTCYLYSLLAAAVWGYSNFLAGEIFSSPVINFWNSAVRLGFFALTSYLLQKIRGQFNREREMSRRDHQTGLLNGAGFHKTLQIEHSRSVRSGKPIGLLFIDLDHFKSVNDSLGHAEGDRVLTAVAQSLERHLRLSDSVARLGGDEFAVILPECPRTELETVAAKLTQCVRDLSRQENWPVTASIGGLVLEEPKNSDDLKTFLKTSDALMYRVKEKGRDGYLIG